MDISIHASFLPHSDPDAALAFYRDTLGFEVRNAVGYQGMRWITVGPVCRNVVRLVKGCSRLAMSRACVLLSSPRNVPESDCITHLPCGRVLRRGATLASRPHNASTREGLAGMRGTRGVATYAPNDPRPR
mgnify:CR=1 FL=1